MINVFIVLILLLICAYAIRAVVKRFKGECGCCGGGPATIEEKKELEGKVIGKYVVEIEGMHCDNCKHRVEKSVNAIEGAACEVNLRKKRATVSFDREISESEIRTAIEKLDFKVTDIQKK